MVVAPAGRQSLSCFCLRRRVGEAPGGARAPLSPSDWRGGGGAPGGGRLEMARCRALDFDLGGAPSPSSDGGVSSGSGGSLPGRRCAIILEGAPEAKSSKPQARESPSIAKAALVLAVMSSASRSTGYAEAVAHASPASGCEATGERNNASGGAAVQLDKPARRPGSAACAGGMAGESENTSNVAAFAGGRAGESEKMSSAAWHGGATAGEPNSPVGLAGCSPPIKSEGASKKTLKGVKAGFAAGGHGAPVSQPALFSASSKLASARRVLIVMSSSAGSL
mmetsp:Transcript_10236/g.33739  ORF Transcript_10236/g.33739 Transcript_10236/m.33739 type:complete len:280 (-) Transcript_10236:2647-3486(-)